MKKIENDRAITLIALVLTIIILLLLAGISISMITGQDGILAKASKAKNDMNKAQVEESVGLAIAEWELEKESNKSYNVTLKEYLDSREEITTAKIEEPLTIVSGDNVVTIDGNNDLATRSKSKNLIKNGYLEDKNNNNFSKFNYHKDGYLYMISKKITGYYQYMSDEYIPVDTSKKYLESVMVKTNNINGEFWIGLTEYDKDYNRIGPNNIMYVSNTLTYLTKDLNDGDTEIYLNDISNFEYNSDTRTYKMGLIFWNYKDSTGYEYPPLTYSRNVWNNLFEYNETNPNVDKENYIIKLKEPWSKGTVEKNTQVSQSSTGAGYKYLVFKEKSKYEWEKYNVIIQGEDTTGYDLSNKFNNK